MLLFSKANTMDNLDDPELRLLKHPRWTPSPVDLTIANTVPPASALIASLGAAYFCSGSPTTANSGYPLNGVMVSGQSSSHVMSSRKQREFIPDNKKDESYWDRRKRNNEAAKRSREKRRISDMVLEGRVLELTRENSILRAELYAIKDKFCLPQTQVFVDTDSVSLSLSENGNRRRSRLLSNIVPTTELNSSGNSSTSYISSSSSPTSQSSHSSDQMAPTPTMAAALPSPTYSPQSLSTQPMCCTPNANPNCPINSVNTATLPFKLRHKAKNNNNDSDSGSDTCVNVLTDITPNHCEINTNVGFNDNNTGSALHDSILKSENYALRSELQRLATEVASLKNVLVFNPTPNSLKTMTSNDSIHSHLYRRDSRSESPDLKSESNEGSNVLSNRNRSH